MFGKGKPFKLTGGFSANSTLNTGNVQGRAPFIYYLNGSINLNIYGQLNLPFAFNLTNSGSSYRLPSIPNRLSLHPSYKWISGHIGDVSMTFSPYTLSGHMFTGVGLDQNLLGEKKLCFFRSGDCWRQKTLLIGVQQMLDEKNTFLRDSVFFFGKNKYCDGR